MTDLIYTDESSIVYEVVDKIRKRFPETTIEYESDDIHGTRCEIHIDCSKDEFYEWAERAGVSDFLLGYYFWKQEKRKSL